MTKKCYFVIKLLENSQTQYILYHIWCNLRTVVWLALCMCLTCVTAAGVNPHQIACIGISAQRSSFITWHRETGEPFHNFITWRDLRADGLVQQWNKSLTIRVCFIEFCWGLVSDIHDLTLGAFCLWVHHRNNIQLKETKCCEILLVGTSTEVVSFTHQLTHSSSYLPTCFREVTYIKLQPFYEVLK